MAPVRLRDFIIEGKLALSLKSYLQLVIANNTDIQIEMLTVETPKNAIMRALSTWDPIATASFNDVKSTTASTGALQGANTVVSLSQPASFSYQQLLPTGMQYSASFFASKNTTNSSFQSLNPALSSNFSINLSQPLIRNRGLYVNKLNLMVARSRSRIAGYNLTTTLLQLVNAAETAYWDVVLARENLRVQQSARQLAADSLKLSQDQLALGAISPLDVYNPQQQLATGGPGRLTGAIQPGANRERVAPSDGGPISIPTSVNCPSKLQSLSTRPIDSIGYDAEREIQKALATRPELKAASQNLDVDELSIQQARNEILPDLSLTAQFTTQGVGGILYQRTNVFSDAGTPSQITTVIPGGFNDALSQMFGFGYPVYSVGLNLRLPIRSHAASADMADALVARKRDALSLRTVGQQVRLDVLTALTNLESSKASVKLAMAAKGFAEKNLDAENQKYKLGTDPVLFVLQAQNVLAQADSAVVQNQVGLRRSLLNLLTRTGELLDERGIVVQ